MNPIPLASFTILLLVGPTACGGCPDECCPDETVSTGPANPPANPNPPAMTTIDYEGPPVRAALEEVDRGAFVVAVDVETPTASWQLEPGDVEVLDGVTVVDLALTSPAADELVAQVITTLHAEVALPEPPPGAVHVRVSRWQRGVQYALVAPDARLAAIVTR